MTTTATNGHAPTLEQLQEALSRARLQRDVNIVTRQIKLTEGLFHFHSPLPGELINPLERFFDGAAWTQPLYPFRRDERAPVWGEAQRDYLRAYARYLADTNPYARAAVEGLTNYVIRKGFGYNLSPVEGADQGAVRGAQRALDDFLEAHGWPDLEREIYQRTRIDGEAFLRFFPQDDGTTVVRLVEPEQVREPNAEPEWAGGVHTEADDAGTVLGYWITYTGAAADGEEVPAEEVLHIKVNVPRNARRGLSDFLAVGEELESARKLLRNEREGEAVRSAIAYLVEHAQAPLSAIQALQQQEADLISPVTNPYTGRQLNVRHMEPGTVQDVSAGQTSKPMPGYDASGGIAVLAATLQAAAARWQAPVWLVSADASANSYANALSAESPFTLAVEAQQSFYMGQFRRAILRVLRHAAPEALKTFRLQVEAPPVTPRNKAEENEINVALHNAGLLSGQTWSVREDLDYDAEQANRVEELAHKLPPPVPVPTRVSGALTGPPYSAPSSEPAAQMAREVDAVAGQ
jgi:hypothetical protein